MATRGKAGTQLKVKKQPSLQAARKFRLLAKAWFLFNAPHTLINVQVLDEDGDPVIDLGTENFSVWIGPNQQTIGAVHRPEMQALPGLYVLHVPVENLPSDKGQYVYSVKAQKGASKGWTLVSLLRL